MYSEASLQSIAPRISGLESVFDAELPFMVLESRSGEDIVVYKLVESTPCRSLMAGHDTATGLMGQYVRMTT